MASQWASRSATLVNTEGGWISLKFSTDIHGPQSMNFGILHKLFDNGSKTITILMSDELK